MELNGWHHPFPVMMNLTRRRCLIVGGGPIAERKLRSLLGAGAEVTLVSPAFTAGILEMGNQQNVIVKKQSYDESIWTIHGEARFALVIAATNDAQVNRQIAQDANAHNLLVNIVDQPELSSFILPSVVRRGSWSLRSPRGELVHQRRVKLPKRSTRPMAMSMKSIWIFSVKLACSFRST